jgi:hypothetical protein
VPFAILGDWNRRIDRFGQDDHLWRDIDDGDPPGLDLRRLPLNRKAECSPSFPQPIDFLVFDARAWQMADEASFQEIVYDPEDRDPARGTPSDHSPIAVTVESVHSPSIMMCSLAMSERGVGSSMISAP